MINLTAQWRGKTKETQPKNSGERQDPAPHQRHKWITEMTRIGNFGNYTAALITPPADIYSFSQVDVLLYFLNNIIFKPFNLQLMSGETLLTENTCNT